MRQALYFWLIIIYELIKLVHGYSELDTSSLRQLNKLSTNRLNLNESDPLNHFKHLNITRVPGTKQSIEIQRYFLNHFHSLNEGSEIPWEIELDNFEENGYNFTNLVFSKKSSYAASKEATNYLLIAAHYDSLIQPDGFIGAIDSAVSCGIMLDLAESISKSLDQTFSDINYDMNSGIKFVFFDGEEAFQQWSPTDSIYGARHLYSKWESKSKIKEIDLFILLDLIGSNDVNFVPSYFEKSHESYNDLSLVESKLIHLFQIEFESYQDKYLSIPQDTYKKKFKGFIEDDHLPFLRAGVPILHLIPHVFPRQWHTIDDDFHHVDIKAINRWNMVLRAYILEYLEIPELAIEEE